MKREEDCDDDGDYKSLEKLAANIVCGSYDEPASKRGYDIEGHDQNTHQ